MTKNSIHTKIRKKIKRKYQIDGISCGGCITRVKKELESHEDIEEAKIYISSKGLAKISMKSNLSVDNL